MKQRTKEAAEYSTSAASDVYKRKIQRKETYTKTVNGILKMSEIHCGGI